MLVSCRNGFVGDLLDTHARDDLHPGAAKHFADQVAFHGTVHIGAYVGKHLYDRDRFGGPLYGDEIGRFQADLPAAGHNDVPANGCLSRQQVRCGDHMLPVDARNGGDHGTGAAGHNDCIRPIPGNNLSRDLTTQLDFDPRLPALSLKPVAQIGLVNVFLGGIGADPEIAAQQGFLLDQGHFMTAQGGNPGRLQTRGPAADDKDAFRVGGLPDGQISFPAQIRIDRTSHLPVSAGHAFITIAAFDAEAHILQCSSLQLAGQGRIGQQRSAYLDHLAFPVGDGFLPPQRVVLTTADVEDDGCGKVLLEHLREVQIAVLLPADRPSLGILQDRFITADAGVDPVDALLLQHPGKGTRLFQCRPIGQQFIDQQGVADGKGGAALFTYPPNDLQGKRTPVLQRAAITVGPFIAARGHELLEQKGGNPMQKDAVKADSPGPYGRADE